MSIQTWEEVLYAALASATQISNSAAEALLVPDTAIPAKFWYPGRTLKMTIKGSLSNVVTTPGTFTIRARYGGLAGTALAASAALALNTTAKTNSQVHIEFIIQCITAGLSATSGSLLTSGMACLGDSRSTAGLLDQIPISGNAAVSSLDLTSAGTLSFTGQFSVATNPTNFTATQHILEALN